MTKRKEYTKPPVGISNFIVIPGGMVYKILTRNLVFMFNAWISVSVIIKTTVS
jgi:hypothetical protein